MEWLHFASSGTAKSQRPDFESLTLQAIPSGASVSEKEAYFFKH